MGFYIILLVLFLYIALLLSIRVPSRSILAAYMLAMPWCTSEYLSAGIQFYMGDVGPVPSVNLSLQ